MEELLTKIQNIPLVKTMDINWPIKNGSVFFGVGLMTSKQLGANLPFDIMGLFFATELIRKTLNLASVTIVIGDVHAKSNNLFPDSKIEQLANKVESELNKIVHNFALLNFRVLRAGSFHNSKDFQEILANLPDMNNEYLRLETADCLWLKKQQNLQLKVGWTMSNTKIVEGNDERFFDETIKQFIPDLSFIHLEPGWTFDLLRPRVSPYISIEGENRLLLKLKEPIPDLGICGPHLAKIVRCAEILWGKLPFNTLEEKIDFLTKKSLA